MKPTVDLIFNYFPELSVQQRDQIVQLEKLYGFWNQQINVVSRKEFDLFYERHVLHSLAIARFIQFKKGTEILDIGTGGGFPGIPLAILFPDVRFHLVDSIGKKIKVVQEVASGLGLQNVTAEQVRAEEVRKKYDFIISRAVTHIDNFMPWVKGKFKQESINAKANGILYLKGGELADELKNIRQYYTISELSDWFGEPFFETKKLVYIRMI